MGFCKSKDLKSGDLIAWADIPSSQGKVNFFKLVRLMTISDYGHVSVVWVKNGVPMQVEATQPRVRVAPIPTNAELYVIPMGLDLTDEQMNEFFKDKIGLKYSNLDAVNGWLGWRLRAEDRWQCAELCLEFYRFFKLQIPDRYTPSRLVKEILKLFNTGLFKLTF